ncbi:MAG TPA: hypothetical protein VLB32_05655 [Candidatus Acidoferrales bacterium]|nr:hypothetical protein [Candidatus Acidoferrales bacterium]
MSEMVAPFTVRARLTGEEYQIRFSHLWSAIATRHSDTMDCKFLVNGRGLIVALPHPALVEFRQRAGRSLFDPEVAQIAAACLREYLEADNDAQVSTLTVAPTDVLRHAHSLGCLP